MWRYPNFSSSCKYFSALVLFIPSTAAIPFTEKSQLSGSDSTAPISALAARLSRLSVNMPLEIQVYFVLCKSLFICMVFLPFAFDIFILKRNPLHFGEIEGESLPLEGKVARRSRDG